MIAMITQTRKRGSHRYLMIDTVTSDWKVWYLILNMQKSLEAIMTFSVFTVQTSVTQ